MHVGSVGLGGLGACGQIKCGWQQQHGTSESAAQHLVTVFAADSQGKVKQVVVGSCGF